MAERKVLNKYYPPDFDPAAIPRVRRGKDFQMRITMMAPYNMRCLTCGNFIYKGTKFNATQETVLNENYLGLRIFRFYIRCTRCSAEICFKTDPKNADYTAEQGATRNFEVWRLADTINDEGGEVEEDNPMKALEERTKESKQEMDILDALEEIKDANSRLAKVDVDSIINRIAQESEQTAIQRQKSIEQHDEEEVRHVFGVCSIIIDLRTSVSTHQQSRIKRLEELPDDEATTEASKTSVPIALGSTASTDEKSGVDVCDFTKIHFFRRIVTNFIDSAPGRRLRSKVLAPTWRISSARRWRMPRGTKAWAS